MDKMAMWIRGLVTLALFGICAWWLVEVAGQVATVPTKDTSGAAVDQFERTKDILIVLLPLLGTALGYWFGAAGRESAEAKAKEAGQEARTANDDAKKTEQKLTSVLATSGDTDLLKKARDQHPEAFGLSPKDGKTTTP